MSARFIGLLITYTGFQIILSSVTFTIEGTGDNDELTMALLVAVKVLLHLALLSIYALGLYRAAREET